MSAALRELSPTVVRYEQRLSDSQAMQQMLETGLHYFDQSWSEFHSASFRETTLKIYNTDHQLNMAMQVCTKVLDLRECLARRCMVPVDQITIIRKNGCTWTRMMDVHEVPYTATVKGIKSFNPQRYEYKHPAAIIGAGYNGLKCGMQYIADKNYNFQQFDRREKAGGTAWLEQANKTSKLQTDMAAFHLWFGPEWGESPNRPETWLDYPTDWSTWPKKDEIIEHMQHAIERVGLLPHIRFNVNVSTMEVIEKKGTRSYTDVDRYYAMTVDPAGNQTGTPFQVNACAVWHYPGAYFTPRQIIYPGEDTFGGKIGFGMSDDIPYYDLPGNRVAILGNGAFGVENIRTACEYGSEKIYMVTRRRNMPCPRMVCWFVHQAITPVPAPMLLNIMTPFFKCARDFMDPWTSHQTYAGKDRKTAVISSASRFGIGDVTFLALAWGRCEYKQDVVKRMSRKTLHLSEGERLENVTVVIKALGLLADFTADKFHKIKELVGVYPNGDFKRFVFADPLGMHFSNVASLSTGIGSYSTIKSVKYFIDFPSEWKKVLDGPYEMLPRQVGDENRPNYQYDAKYQATASMMIETTVPVGQKTMVGDIQLDDYMHRCVHASHPLDKVWEECVNGWNQYQDEWRAQGFKHPNVPYPINFQDVEDWFKEYEEKVGPNRPEDKVAWYEKNMTELQKQRFMSYQASFDPANARAWWKESDQDIRKVTKGWRS